MTKERLEQGLSISRRGVPTPPFENTIQYYWFSPDEIADASSKGTLLKLNMDLGKACRYSCKSCYVETRLPPTSDYIARTTKRAKGIIDEAVPLGLKVLQIVGAGEPFMFPGLLEVMQYAYSQDVRTLVFTAGAELGDDRLAATIFRRDGIRSADDLVGRIKELEAAVVVKHLSFDDDLQSRLIGVSPALGYAQQRDRAIISLAAAGLNKQTPTRLGVDCLLSRENAHEAVELFDFFNSYNIFCMLNTAVDCGKTKSCENNLSVLSPEEAVQIAARLYKHAKERDIPFDARFSSYFLGKACSELTHAIFIGDDDTVKACPGGPMIGLYAPGQLARIVAENPVRLKFAGTQHNPCIARYGSTLPCDFEHQVKSQLVQLR